MAQVKDPGSLDFVGDYQLDDIDLLNYRGAIVNIKDLIVELNIYEDIHMNALTGTAVVLDALNVISKSPLQGTERLAFKLSTVNPGQKTDIIIDASEETGHPFHIYKLSNRKKIADGMVSYILHFCSREMFRNVRTKVSQSYKGQLHSSVATIFQDKTGLDSKKKLFLEPTRNSDTVVIPNLRPFDAINLIADKALPKNGNGVGYYFYETTKGFHFRSYESLLATQGLFPRDEKDLWTYDLRLLQDDSYKLEKGQRSVDDFEFIQHYDTVLNQATGVYANRVITHNIYDKSYTITDYDYHAHFADHFHADQVNSATKENYPITDMAIDEDQLRVSEHPTSYVSLEPSTKFLHNEDKGSYGTLATDDGLNDAKKLSQRRQFVNSEVMKATLSGHSYLQAGDVIHFRMPSVEPDRGEKQRGYEFDDLKSGRYVISKLRHRVTKDEYKTIVECVKDSTYKKIPSGTSKRYPYKSREDGQLIDIYEVDKYATNKGVIKPPMLS